MIYVRTQRPCHTLGQNHKKHSIALLVPFVSKKGTNRGIKCQFDILEKNPKGGPFYVKKIFISISAQISCVSFQGQKHSTCKIWAKSETKNVFDIEESPLWIFLKIRILKIRKISKEGPFYIKKFFVSDFAQISHVECFCPWKLTHEIWAETEMKIFLT